MKPLLPLQVPGTGRTKLRQKQKRIPLETLLFRGSPSSEAPRMGVRHGVLGLGHGSPTRRPLDARGGVRFRKTHAAAAHPKPHLPHSSGPHIGVLVDSMGLRERTRRKHGGLIVFNCDHATRVAWFEPPRMIRQFKDYRTTY